MVASASRFAAESLRVLPRKRLSRMIGRLADLEGPPALLRRAMDTFVRVYDVDMGEAEVPPGGFESFDAFFTRRLKAGARPIDPDPTSIVAPSDGRLLDSGPIDAGATFRIKGRLYRVEELVGAVDEATPYEGGTFAVVYLAPPDYHRIHAPVSGAVTAMRYVPGTLFPVNSIGLEHIEGLFSQNERVVVHQQSEEHGDVATVLVGAIGVGRISVSFDDVVTNRGHESGPRRYHGAGPRLERGAELGKFHLGSTVIVLLGRGSDLKLVTQPGQRVRMGERLFARSAG